MAETTERVQRWRQRLKDEGKEALTIYLAHDVKLRLDDLAHTWHMSVSELVEHALRAFHPGNPATFPVTDTSQLRTLIQEELAHLLTTASIPPGRHEPETSVTETLLIVPDTPTGPLPPLALDSATSLSALTVQPEGTLADIGREGSADPAPVEELSFAPDASEGVPDVLLDPPGVETLPIAAGQANALHMSALDYDPTKFVLGKLCPGRHEYQGTGKTLLTIKGTGKTLLTIKGRRCYACENEKYRAKRPPALDYDPAKFHLGALCSKEGHGYRETGQSLRTTQGRCRVCLNAANEKSRQRKKETASTPA